jgi:hypothetical protein
MALYTFYPRMRDGSALTFDAIELDDDEQALGHCQLVLAEHPSATQVIVWEGDRRVCRLDRGLATFTPAERRSGATGAF